MERIRIGAFAKLNLSLNLLPERGERGYYAVRFLNTQLDLADSVELERLPEAVFTGNIGRVDGEENIAIRAARLMFERHSLPGGLSVKIDKRIPPRSGLGGGSSDAAAVINGVNELFSLSLSSGERVALGKTLGMDVCYCVIGGLALVEGIGDVVTPLRLPLPELDVLVASPGTRKQSTAWAYSILDARELGRFLSKLDRLVEGIEAGDERAVAANLHNDFEEPIGRHFPVTARIKHSMLELGAMNAMLAGSGLAVVGLFERNRDLRRAADELERSGIACLPAKTVAG